MRTCSMQSAQNDSPAVDAALTRRPGVPEYKKPAPVGHAHWEQPEQQEVHGEQLKDASRRDLTATFGTGPAPRGLSGILRRIAYRIPDYRAKRWALLLIADRIDKIEHGWLGK